MSAERKPQIFDPERTPEPRYFTRVPDDALDDPRLSRSDQAIFAQLLKGHWVDSKRHTITQTELSKRCRISVRKLRPHLAKLESLEYVTRLRVAGRDTMISLTYQLRPSLELTPNESGFPVIGGNQSTPRVGPKGPTPRTQRSDPSDPKVRPLGPKGPTPRTFVYKGTRANSEKEEERRREKENPPQGGNDVASAPATLAERGISWNALQQECIDIATRRWGASNGDSCVGDLLHSYEADLVREALDRHWAKVGQAFHVARLIGTCRSMLANGWKPEGPAQRRTGWEVPYKPEGRCPPPAKPMTDEELAEFHAEGKRLFDEHCERVDRVRNPK